MLVKINPTPTAVCRSFEQESFINNGMSREQCESESIFVIFGGWESTASAIRSILVHTMITPRVLENLRQEMDEAVRRGGVSTPISFEQANVFHIYK